MLPNYNPIQVDAFCFQNEARRPVAPEAPIQERVYARIYTTSGGIYIAKRVPLERVLTNGWPESKPQLYVTRAGNFFSYSSEGLRQVKPANSPCSEAYRKTCGGWRYANLPHFGDITCHKAVYVTWIGDVPAGYQIDHINGDPLDNRAKNLEAVTPQENTRRARILRIMRKTAMMDNRPDLMPQNREISEIKQIFNQITFNN